MDNEKIKQEQKYLDKVVEFIKETEKKFLVEIEDARKDYYNTELDLDEQYRKQDFFDGNINKAEGFMSVIANPFFGKIEGITVNGKQLDYYIGHKSILDNQYTFVYDWKTPIGKAFRNRLYKFEELNILSNLYFQIQAGKIQNLEFKISKSNINEMDLDLTQVTVTGDSLNSNNKTIEYYKANRDIIPSISKNQSFILDFDPSKNLIIQGVPGSGKTALGGLRLSLIIDQSNSHYSESDPYFNYGIFITNNDMMKIYSQGFYQFEDLKRIKFLNLAETLNLYSYKKIKVFRKNCYLPDLGIKGKIHQIDEDNKIAYVDIYGGQRIKVKLSKVHFINHEFKNNPLTNSVFGNNPNIDSITKFQNHYLNAEEFEFLNDPKLLVHIKSVKFEDSSDEDLIDLLDGFKVKETSHLITILRLCRELLKLKRYEQINRIYDSKYVTHVFVDEGQDYTLVDFFLLKTIYPNATFTVSGDVNQSDGLRLSQDNWNRIKDYLDADIHIINTCFRSSKKIIETLNQRMSTRIYGEAQGWSGKSTGIVKTISSFNDFLMKNYKDIDSKDICIIYIREETKELLLELSNKYKFKIYNAYETKGMEFHSVVILDTDLIVQNNFKTKFFYMLVSRAIVNLYILENK